MLVAVLAAFLARPSELRADDAQADAQAQADAEAEAQRRSTAVALNYCRASFHRIRQYPSVRVLAEEQEKILNNLNMNGVADESVIKLYSSVLEEISQVQLADRERDLLGDKHKQFFRRQMAANVFTLATQAAGTDFVGAVRTGANSWWDYRNMGWNRELDSWRIDKERMTAVVSKSSLFLDTCWRMARDKNIPDRWLVRGDDLDRLELATRETDPEVRLRVFSRMEPFMECYPPYWYYVGRTQQSLGQLFAAAGTYERLASLEQGHFRKDDMLAAGLANLAGVQDYLKQAGATESARRALACSTDCWEANLICARVLQRHGQYDTAEEAILRNLDVDLERSQSLACLLGVYAESNNYSKLAARLSDPQTIREVSAPLLLQSAAALGNSRVPAPLMTALAASMQAVPRLQFGRDDIVVGAGPAWQLHAAQVSLQIGDHTHQATRVVPEQDRTSVRFEGVVELGGPFSEIPDNVPATLIVQYPGAPTVRIQLSSARSGAAPAAPAGPVSISSPPRPSVFRMIGVQLAEKRLSFAPGPAAPDVRLGFDPGEPDETLTGAEPAPGGEIPALPVSLPVPGGQTPPGE